MNRYTRINDLLGTHASRSFQKDITIERFRNPRKSKHKTKIIKTGEDTKVSEPVNQNEPEPLNMSQKLYSILKEEIDDLNDLEYYSDPDSSDDDTEPEEQVLVYEPKTNLRHESYIFNMDEIEDNMYDVMTKLGMMEKMLVNMEQYVDLEEKLATGKIVEEDIYDRDIPIIFQYHLFNQNHLYTLQDCEALKTKINKCKAKVNRYEKSMNILNDNEFKNFSS